jgi:Rad3-related DNA helicase
MQHLDLEGNFPHDLHPVMRAGQKTAFIAINRDRASGQSVTVIEAPVGSGKTDIGYTYLKALEEQGAENLFYLVPNKTLAEQVHEIHPDVLVAYGRNEHPCLYYPDEKLQADEIPCSLLRNCPHRVHQETGETHTPGAVPCPYLQQKFEAKQGDGIVACTTAYYLFTVLYNRDEEYEVGGVVVDEAHRFADSIRAVLSTEITDWKLKRAVEVLRGTGSAQAEKLNVFLKYMNALVGVTAMGREVLLEEDEIRQLYETLLQVSPMALTSETSSAVASGQLDTQEDREVLVQIEDIARSVTRFQRGMRFALPRPEDGKRGEHPLKYIFAFGRKELEGKERVQYKIVIKDYFVVPLVKKLLPEDTLAYSATVSDPEILSFETGIKGGFHSISSNFPVANARIYMPTDTANLAVKSRNKQDKTKMLRKVARAAKRFSDQGHRSLVIVVSQEERAKFLMLAKEEGLDTLTYGDGIRPREAVNRFRAGEGQCLVGTSANYSEGVDLPRQMAPVIFYYRPSYPRPDDPATVFEERRFGNARWKLWNWRVMVNFLQARGRNIRSETDLGVTFLISQQFRRFAFPALPKWLQPAYRGELTFEQCIEDAELLLRPEMDEAA